MLSCFIGGPGKKSERPVYVYRGEEEIHQGPIEGLGGPEWNLDAQKRDLEDQWRGLESTDCVLEGIEKELANQGRDVEAAGRPRGLQGRRSRYGASSKRFVEENCKMRANGGGSQPPTGTRAKPLAGGRRTEPPEK